MNNTISGKHYIDGEIFIPHSCNSHTKSLSHKSNARKSLVTFFIVSSDICEHDLLFQSRIPQWITSTRDNTINLHEIIGEWTRISEGNEGEIIINEERLLSL